MAIQRIIVAVNLMLLTLGAYFGAGLFYQLVGLQGQTFQPMPLSAEDSAPQAKLINHPLAYYRPILNRDLFQTQKPDTTTDAADAVDLEELEQTQLKLKLWGTVSGPSDRTYAVIEDTQKREQNLYRVGDSIQNATIKMVLREKVVLSVDGRDEVLSMEELQQGAGSGRPVPVARSVDLPPRPAGTQRISLMRDLIDNAMQDVSKLMTEIAIQPHIENGQPSGLALTSIKPNSIFRRMGLRNGDILMGVNGQEIRSVDDALRLYESLKESSDVNVQLKRRGRERTINYTIR